MKRRGLRGWWDMLAEVYPYTQSYPNAIPSPFPPHPNPNPLPIEPQFPILLVHHPHNFHVDHPAQLSNNSTCTAWRFRCDEGCVRDFGGFWELGRGGRPGGIGG